MVQWAGDFSQPGAAALGSYMTVFASAMVMALMLNLGAAVILLVFQASKRRSEDDERVFLRRDMQSLIMPSLIFQ